MALIEFFGSTKSRSNITLRSNGTIFLSHAMLNKLHKEAEAVYLYIDDEKPILGLKFSAKYDDSKKNCKPMNKEKSGVSFSILNVLRHYNVNIKKPYKNMDSEIENDIVILDLEKICAENLN